MTSLWLTTAALWVGFTLTILSTRFDLVRLREVAAGVAALGLVVVARAMRRGWRPGPPDLRIMGILAAQFGLLVLATLGEAAGTRAFLFVQLVVLTGIGWLAWAETRGRSLQPAAAAPPDPALMRVGFAACLVVAAALVAGFWVANNQPLVAAVEELLYRIQARAIAGSLPRYVVDPETLQAFQLPWIAYSPGTLVPQSAAAWPLLLAGAMRIGIEPWVGLSLTMVNLALTILVGSRLFGPKGGLLAGAFFAVNPLVARFGPTYLAHAATLTLLLGAMMLLFAAERRPRESGRRMATEMGAGALLAAAILMRPLGATLIVLALVSWIVLRRPVGERAASATIRRVLVGGVPLIALFVLADGFSLGGPLRAGHELVAASVVSAREITPLYAATTELLKGSWFSFGAVGIFAGVGLLLLCGIRPPLHATLPFLLLPAAGLLLSDETVRLYHDAVPFLAFGFAWSLLEIGRRDVNLARTAGALTVAGALSVSTLLLLRMSRVETVPHSVHAAVEAARAQQGPILLIVPVGTPEYIVTRLWVYNLDGVGGGVVVARETNPHTIAMVRQRFAGRRALVIESDRNGGWQLRPVERGLHVATGGR